MRISPNSIVCGYQLIGNLGETLICKSLYFSFLERWQSGLTRTPGKREYLKSTGSSNLPLSAIHRPGRQRRAKELPQSRQISPPSADFGPLGTRIPDVLENATGRRNAGDGSRDNRAPEGPAKDWGGISPVK